MASESIIAELLRQDAEEKARQRAEVSPQAIMASIMQGVQIYDAVKGLGAKYGTPGKPAVPEQPAIPSITQQGTSLGSQITPRTMPGVPSSTIGAGAQELAGQGTYADLLKSVLPSGPGMNAPTIGQTQTMGQPSAPPNLQALLASMSQSTGSPAIPGTPAVPTTPGVMDATILGGLQNFPDAARQYAASKGINATTILPEFKADQIMPLLLAKLAGAKEVAEIGTASKEKVAAETTASKEGIASRSLGEKSTEETNKAKRKSWDALLKAAAKGDVPPEILKAGVAAGKSLGEDTSEFEKPQEPGLLKKWIDFAKKKLSPPSTTAKKVVTFKSSDGTVHTTMDIEAAKRIDPNLVVIQ